MGGVVLVLISIYRISLRENRQLMNYALLILLNDGVHKVQRDSLIEFIRQNDAKDFNELGWNVRRKMEAVVLKHFDNILGVNSLIWKFKKP